MNAPSPHVAALMVDVNGHVLSCTWSFEAISGYAGSHVRQANLRQFLTIDAQDNRALLEPTLSGTISTGQLCCADGQWIPIRLTISLVRMDDEADEKYLIVLSHEDYRAKHQRSIQDLPIGTVIDELPCLFYVIDTTSHLVLWNLQIEDALEMSGDEIRLETVDRFFDPADRPVIVQKLAEAFEHGTAYIEAELVGKHGKRTSYLFNCAGAQVDGQACLFGTGVDISARKRTEQILKVRDRAIFSSINAICITCCDGDENRIEYVNPAFEHITGYTLEEIKGCDPRFMGIEGCDTEERHRIRLAIQSRESVRSVLRNARKNGEVFYNQLLIDPVINADGKVTHFVAVINDITEAKQYEGRIHQMALHDPLTGLANRTLLLECLKLAIDRAHRYQTVGALAFIDLDNFKHINDNFGHYAGDTVLRELADRLRSNMRDVDTVARIGGDEFVILISQHGAGQHLADLLERIRISVCTPMLVGGREIVPSASIGVSLFPHDGDSFDQVMRSADAAMYHAKSLGKNNVQFYSAELGQAMHDRISLQASLSRAIDDGQLVLFYQPKVDLRSGKMIGAEALVRWNNPEEGLIPPDRFIPLAEETGLIVPLGDWVIDTACRMLSTLASLGLHDLVISVNLSARQLRRRQFPQHLAEAVQRYNVSPDKLELEMTESQLLDRPDDAIITLNALKKMGFKLSIDDFGTGYSSLSYLEQFPVDFIKIDRSFLCSVGPESDAIITRAIIALGHALMLRVIAEGVETLEQLSFLRRHGCDQMQGFYFSAAVPQDEFLAMLRENVQLRPGPSTHL